MTVTADTMRLRACAWSEEKTPPPPPPPDRRCRASTAAGRAPTSICSTASRCCSRSRARSRSFPNVDAIQEFKIESNSPPAEFGRFNGGVVNLTTKSGGNALRGTVFEFFRHEALNARNFFASANPAKPLFRRNQFGGVLGGPIRRDRTFFFVDYQGQRQTIGRTVISTVPTLLQRQGIFTEADRRPRARPSTIRRRRRRRPAARRARPFPGNTIPSSADGSGRAGAAGALSAADQRRHGEQLPPRRQRDRRSGSVGVRLDHQFRQPRPGCSDA